LYDCNPQEISKQNDKVKKDMKKLLVSLPIFLFAIAVQAQRPSSIQGAYLVRGAREGNQIMMAKGYEVGLGFLKNTAIDQHIDTRKRENDMAEVISATRRCSASGCTNQLRS
jgi:hypothetical protein